MNYLNEVLFTQQSYDVLFGTPSEVPPYFKGDTIGKYSVTGTLLRGENSDVYSAVDTLTEQEVVIKYVNGNPLNEKTLKRQNLALNELRKWSAVPPGDRFLAMYDAFYDARIQKYAIVTPYVPRTHSMGLSVGELKENGYAFSVEDVEHLFCEVYKAFCYIREKTGQIYIHCDIKPDNLLVVSDGKDLFRECRVMLADCGSYSADVRYIGKYKDDLQSFWMLSPEERDFIMLLETGEKLCPGYRNGESEFCAFLKCADLRSILDLQKYFGEASLPKEEKDCLKNLISAYTEYSFAGAVGSKRDEEVTRRFNNAANDYIEDTSDAVLPNFLCLKDLQAVGKYEDSEKIFVHIYNLCGLSPSRGVRRFLEYSGDFANELIIRNAVALFHNTDLENATDEQLYHLCSFFANIDVNKCFDFFWIGEAALLCEYMAAVKQDLSLIETMRFKAGEMEPNPLDSKQIRNDKKIFACVFECMGNRDETVRKKCAEECAGLAMAEPYNLNYLFFAAKTLMLSSEITAAQVFCHMLINEVNQTVKHSLPVNNESTKFHVIICLYWIVAYTGIGSDGHIQDLEQMLKRYFNLEKTLTGRKSVEFFRNLKKHILKEITPCSKVRDVSECIHEVNSILSGSVYGEETVKQYRLKLLCNLVKSACEDAYEAIRNPKNTDRLNDLLETIQSVDANSPVLSEIRGQLEFEAGNTKEAEVFLNELAVKKLFSNPANPYLGENQEKK